MTTEISNPLTSTAVSAVCEGNLSVKSKKALSDGWPSRYFRYEPGSGVLAQWESKTGSQLGPRLRVTRVEDLPDRSRKRKNRFDLFVSPVTQGDECPPAVSVAATSASDKQRWLAALATSPGGLSRVSVSSESSSANSSPNQSPLDHVRRLSGAGAGVGAPNAPGVLSPNSSAGLGAQVSELEMQLLGADGASALAGKGLVQRIEELEMAMHGETKRSLGSLHVRVQQLHGMLFQGAPGPAPTPAPAVSSAPDQAQRTTAPLTGALVVQKRVATLDDDNEDIGGQGSAPIPRPQSGGAFDRGKAVVHNSNNKVAATPLHARDESHPCHQLLYILRWLQANPDYWMLTLFSVAYMINLVFCFTAGMLGGQVDGINRFIWLGLTMAWAASYAPYKVWGLSFPMADEQTKRLSKKFFHYQFGCLTVCMFMYYGLNAPKAFLWGFFVPSCSANQYANSITGLCEPCPEGALTAAQQCCGSPLLNIENTNFFPQTKRYKKSDGCVSLYDGDEIEQVQIIGHTVPLGASALDYRTLYCKWDNATNCTLDTARSDGGVEGREGGKLENRCKVLQTEGACLKRGFRDLEHKFMEDQSCKLSQDDRWFAVKADFHRWYGPEPRVYVCAAINATHRPDKLAALGLDDTEITQPQGKQPSAMGDVLMVTFVLFSIVLFVYDSAILPYIYKKYWITSPQSYLWWPIAFGLTMCSILWYNYTLVFYGLEHEEKSDASGLHLPNHTEDFRSRVFDALFIILASAAVKIVFVDTFQTWSTGMAKQSDVFCILCFTYFTYWMSYMCADTILKLQEWAGQDQFLVVLSLCAFSAMMLVLFVLSRIAASRCFDYQRVPTVMFYMFFMADMLQELMMSDLQVDNWQFWVVMFFDLWLLIMRDADMWEDVSDYLQDKLGPVAGTCVTLMQLLTGRGDDAAESITNRVVGPLQHRIRAMTAKDPTAPASVGDKRKLNRDLESDADIASAGVAAEGDFDNTTSSSGSDDATFRVMDKKTWGAMERKAHRIVGASECALSEIVSSVTLFTWVMAEDWLEAPRLTFGFCSKQRDNGKIVYATVLLLQLFGLYCSHKIILWKAKNDKANMLKKEHAEKSLPANKTFHFFLSHKKTHTRHGNASESLALSIKDAMTARGFTGFVDVDSLRTISNEALAEHVVDSCCLVLILNDETLASEWVRHEVTQAVDSKIPVITVIDQDLYNKQATIDYAMSQNFSTVLNHQVIGYTKQARESAHDLIVDQIVEATLAVRRGRLEALTKHLQSQTIWTPNMSSNAEFSWRRMCKRMCSEEKMLPYKIMTVILVVIALSFTNAFVKIDLIQALDRGLTVPVCEDNLERWRTVAPCMTQLCGILKRAELEIDEGDYPTVTGFHNNSGKFRSHALAYPVNSEHVDYAFWKIANTNNQKMPDVQAQSCDALQDPIGCRRNSPRNLSFYFNATAVTFYCAKCHLPNQLTFTKSALEAPQSSDYENRCKAKNRIEDLYPCVFGDDQDKRCNCCPGAQFLAECNGKPPRTFARCTSTAPQCRYDNNATGTANANSGRRQ